MPHLVLLYTPNLEREADFGALCRELAATMRAARDDDGKPVFPTGGVRVLAYPAAHAAVADSERDYAFVYLNLRMGRGRGAAVIERTGEALLATARTHLGPLLDRRLVGVTLQIDEGPELYSGRFGNLHSLFGKP